MYGQYRRPKGKDNEESRAKTGMYSGNLLWLEQKTLSVTR